MSNYYQTGLEDKRKAKEINLKEIYKVIKRRIFVILVAAVLAASIGVIKSTSSVTYLYQSSARVIIGADQDTRTTLQVVIRDSTVLDKVVSEMNLPITSAALANQITAVSIDNSQVVSINVIDNNPEMAAKIADTTARVFKEEVPKIAGKDCVLLLSQAKVNPTPINSGHSNTILIALVVGLVLGIGLAFLLDSLDDTIRSEEEVEKVLGLQVLGKVSKMKKKNTQSKRNNFELGLRGETIGTK